jgi:hypothetical protein
MSDDVVFDRDGEPHFDSACARRDYYRQEEIKALRREVEEACLEMIERIDSVLSADDSPELGSGGTTCMGSVEDVFNHYNVPDPMTAPEVSPYQRIIDRLKAVEARRDD